MRFYTLRELTWRGFGECMGQSDILCPECNYRLDFHSHYPKRGQVWLTCPYQDGCEYARGGGRLATEEDLDEGTEIQVIE